MESKGGSLYCSYTCMNMYENSTLCASPVSYEKQLRLILASILSIKAHPYETKIASDD